MSGLRIIDNRTGREVDSKTFGLPDNAVPLRDLKNGARFKLAIGLKQCEKACSACSGPRPCNAECVYEKISNEKQCGEGEILIKVLLVNPPPLMTIMGIRYMCPNSRVLLVEQ